MLHYLPIPHHDELLYSVFARYAVHMGILSPKQCLDDLFGCRTVVATADLPSHIDTFLANAGHLWDISPENLIYRHTLFPLYALFVPDMRRQSALSQMRSSSGGTLHVQLGVSASMVSPPSHLRFCPACLQDHQRRFGEYFWLRPWQAIGVKACNRHGPLSDSNVQFRHLERHRFVAATPSTCMSSSPRDMQTRPCTIDRAFGNLVNQLLEMPPLPSPTYDQWSQFYHELALDLGYANGTRVRHQDLLSEFQRIWSGSSNGTGQRTPNWLKGLFCKHRKSFSYVQHLSVWAAFLSGQSAADIIQRISDLPPRQGVQTYRTHPSLDAGDLPKYRSRWRQALESFGHRGIKWIRANVASMAALYAWLYRHDRRWLLKLNEEYRVVRPAAPERANWPERDQALCRKLRQIADNHDSKSARRTRAWYINRLPHHATVEKNLGNLPLCTALLQEISESVADYQIRRCKYAMRDLISAGLPPTRWRVERKAGIGGHNMKPTTNQFLATLEGAVCGKSDNSEYPQ